jgi:hemerythrin
MIEAHAWNRKLDLGHEAMDHDHHLQIALASAVVDAIEQGRPWLARRLAGQLLDYSGVHFGSEESLMDASGYGEKDGHAGEHRALLQAMEEIDGALQRDERELALAFAVDLRAGLAGHIAGSDGKLAEHVAPRAQPARQEKRVRH